MDGVCQIQFFRPEEGEAFVTFVSAEIHGSTKMPPKEVCNGGGRIQSKGYWAEGKSQRLRSKRVLGGYLAESS